MKIEAFMMSELLIRVKIGFAKGPTNLLLIYNEKLN